jgi:hypothetical protein
LPTENGEGEETSEVRNQQSVTFASIQRVGEEGGTAIKRPGNLFLFNGYFGRLNYGKNIIALFDVHPPDRTSRDNGRQGPSRSSDRDF